RSWIPSAAEKRDRVGSAPVSPTGRGVVEPGPCDGRQLMARTALAVCLGALAWPWIGCLADDRPGEVRVGPNVQVSKERADVPHWEVVVAAASADSKRLLAGSMLRYDAGEDQCAGYLSTDGGKSWKPVLEPGGRAETRGTKRAADPAVAFGP